MANFFTSFATGGLKAATNNMYRVAEERGAILDDLRPKVEDKFSLLNNNVQKYTDIYRKVSKYDGGQSAFNYFFDRGDIDTSLSTDEAAKYIMDNANAIPTGYSAGDNISGEDRIAQAYESGVSTINNYITDVGAKHKLGDRTKALLLENNNPMLASFKEQMQMPTRVLPYTSGVMGGSVADMKNDLIMNTSKINAYVSTVLNRQPTMNDYTNPDIADAAGATALTNRDIPMLRDAIGEKDYFQEAINEGVSQFIANSLPQYVMEGETQEDALGRIFNTVQNVYDYIEFMDSPPPTGSQKYVTETGLAWEDIPLNSEFTIGDKVYKKVGTEQNDSSIEIVG